MYLFGYRLPGMSSLLLWGALWEVTGQAKITFFIPPLSKVLSTLYEVLGTSAFQNALKETAYAFCFGVFYAVAVSYTHLTLPTKRIV